MLEGKSFEDCFVGRESEYDALAGAFQQAIRGDVRICFIEGAAGCGKSTLVKQFLNSLVKTGAFYGYAKIREHDSVPIAGPHKMAQDISNCVLSLPPKELEIIRQIVVNENPEATAILMQLLPRQMSKLMDWKPEDASPQMMHARRSFIEATGRILGAIASRTHPVVLCYDDFQWVDQDTIEIIETPTMSNQLHHTLLIFTFRPEIWDQPSPGRELLLKLKTFMKPLHIKLEGFGSEELSEFLSLTKPSTRIDPRVVSQLLTKTGGNPMYVREVLGRILNTQHPLDMQTISSLPLPDSMIEMVMQSFETLSGIEKRFLQSLSILDCDLTTNSLGMLLSVSPETLSNVITQLTHKGWLMQDDDMIRMAHDRLREGVRERIWQGSNKRLLIGLLAGLKQLVEHDPTNENALLEYVDKIRLNMSWLKERGHDELLKLSERACEILSQRTANKRVVQLVFFVIGNLNEEEWSRSRDKLERLCSMGAEAALMLRDEQSLKELFEISLEHNMKGYNSLRINACWAQMLIGTSRYREGIQISEAALQREGIRLNLSCSPKRLGLRILAIYARLKSGELDRLLAKRRFIEQRDEVMVDLLSFIGPATFYTDIFITGALATASMELVFRHKITTHTAMALAGFSLVLAELGLYKDAMDLADRAVALANADDTPTYIRLRTLVILYNSILFNRVGLAKAVQQIDLYGRQLASIGDHEFLAQACFYSCYIGFHSGEPVDRLLQRTDENIRTVKLLVCTSVHEQMNIYAQFCHNISVADYRVRIEFDGPYYSENEQESARIRNRDRSAKLNYLLLKGLLFYLFDRAKEANNLLEAIADEGPGAEGCCTLYSLWLIKGLSFYDILRKDNLGRRNYMQMRRRLSQVIKRLRKYLPRSPQLIESKVWLLEGLEADLKKRWQSGLTQLNRSYDEAMRHGRVHEAYMAKRIALRILLRMEEFEAAREAMEAARDAAKLWGAANLEIYLNRTSQRMDMMNEPIKSIPVFKRIAPVIALSTSIRDAMTCLAKMLSEEFGEPRFIALQLSEAEDDLVIESAWKKGTQIEGKELKVMNNELDWQVIHRAINSKDKPAESNLISENPYSQDQFLAWTFCLTLESNQSFQDKASTWLLYCRYSRVSVTTMVSMIQDLNLLYQEIKPLLIQIALGEKHRLGEERFRLLCDQSPSGIIQISKFGIIEYVNQQVALWLADFESVVFGKQISVSKARWCARLGLPGLIEQAKLKPDQLIKSEISLSNGHNDQVLVLLVQAFLSPSKDIYEVVITDITATRIAKDEIHKRHEAEERASETERQLAVLGHELRTPLNMILSPAQTLLDNHPESSHVKNTLRTIIDNGYRLKKIINDILLSIERHNIVGDDSSVPFAIKGFLSAFYAETRELVESKRLLYTLENLTKETFIQINPVHLERILFNLLQNSIKYTGERGSILISGMVQKESLVISVKDNGIGINDEDINKVSDMFYRGSNASTVSAQGVGLGLFVVRQLTEQHQGKLSISRLKEGGTEIKLRFPIVSDISLPKINTYMSDVRETELGYMRSQLEATFEDDDLDQASSEEATRILLIDDEVAVNQHLTTELSKHYQVISKLRSDEARQALSETSFDLILLDIMMPGEDGLSLLKWLRKDLKLSVPVFIISSHTTQESVREALREGASDVVHKPIDLVELQKRMEVHLKLQANERELRRNNARLERSYKAVQDAEALLIHNEKEKMLAMISAGILHEIRNALNNTMMSLKCALLNQGLSAETKDHIAMALEQQNNILNMSNDIRSFANPELVFTSRIVNVFELGQRAVKYMKREIEGIEVALSSDTGQVKVRGYESMIIQIFINLISNSIRAIRERFENDHEGCISIKLEDEGEEFLKLTFRDNGKGIPAEIQSKIFDMYFSASQNASGSGIGLAMCKHYAEKHHGDIHVESEIDKQTTFVVLLRRE